MKNAMVIALFEEYRRTTILLKEILSTISKAEFQLVRDAATEDPDCVSIQTVATHIVQSGYTYINYVNTISNIEWREYEKTIETPTEAITEIDKMLNYTEKSLEQILHFENK